MTSCIICDIGSIEAFDPNQDEALLTAYDELSTYFKALGPINALFPIETGPENSLAPFVVAAKLSKLRNVPVAVVDGDGAGRAVPTLPLTTFSALGTLRNPTPVAIANGEGDVMLVKRSKFAAFDVMLRHIANVKEFKASASLAMWPDTLAELASKCVVGTISNALACGQFFEAMRTDDSKRLVDLLPIINKLNGYLIAKGIISNIIREDEEAFTFTTVKIQGLETTYTVLAQNESLIAYDDLVAGPIAMAPDSICYLTDDFKPLTNVEIMNGQRIYVIGLKANIKLLENEMISGFRQILEHLGYAGKLALVQTGVRLGDLLIELKKTGFA